MGGGGTPSRGVIQGVDVANKELIRNLAHEIKDWEKMTQAEVRDRIKELKSELGQADAFLEEKNKKVRE